MITNPTDEEIINIIHWLDAKYKRHGEDEDKEGADLLRAWLAERQAAKDGVTTNERESFEKWITEVWRPDDGRKLLEKEFPHFAFAAWQARAALGQRQEVMDEKSWFKENDEAIATLAYQKLDEELADKLTFERSLEMFPQATYSLCRSAVGNFVIAVLEKYRAALQSIALPVKVPDGLQWIDGIPVHPWDKEWFIAELDNGDRVVLKALPDEYTYDFKTADETYLAKRRIKRWMQFPDSEFTAAPAHNGKKEG